MTYRQDFTVPAELMEQVAEQGLEIVPELIRIVINAAMQESSGERIFNILSYNADSKSQSVPSKSKIIKSICFMASSCLYSEVLQQTQVCLFMKLHF